MTGPRTQFEQQVAEMLHELHDLWVEAPADVGTFSTWLAPRLAAAIDEASRNTLSVETARAAGLAALHGGPA